jgi:N-acetylglucosaminyl-diphospho-decaprenol L-rhamnosyltransferase
MSALPGLSIVIVNWNTGSELRTCLRSIIAARRPGVRLCEVVVVDNHSSDDSMQRLPEEQLPLRLFFNPENRGFAAACNQGALCTRGDLLLFLNPDMRLQADSLSVPLDFMARRENAKVGICGIQLLRRDGMVARDCWRFPTLAAFIRQILGLDHLKGGGRRALVMSDWEHDHNAEVDHVIGAFYLVRRQVYQALRGFDERFFVYFEDLDFSLRSHQLGWRTVYLASVRAWHLGGVSSGKVPAARLFYSLHSRFRYAFKHWSTPQACLLVALSLLVEPLTRSAWCILRGKRRELAGTVGAYLMLYKRLPRLLRLVRSSS